MLEHWIASLGYVAVAVGTFLEGETVLLIAGALAQRGTLAWPGVVVAAFAGSLAGDQTWFLLGRRMGPALLRRWPSLQTKLARAESGLARYGDRFVLGFRFVVGIRMVAPFVLGTTRYPSTRFIALNVLGGALWSTSITFLGWSLGAGVTQVLQRVGRAEELLAAGIALGALAYAAAWRLRLRSRVRHRSTLNVDAATRPAPDPQP